MIVLVRRGFLNESSGEVACGNLRIQVLPFCNRDTCTAPAEIRLGAALWVCAVGPRTGEKSECWRDCCVSPLCFS